MPLRWLHRVPFTRSAFKLLYHGREQPVFIHWDALMQSLFGEVKSRFPSQVSDHMDMDKEDSDEAKVAAISQVLAVGESLWVKVVEIKEPDPGSDRGPKLGCSIKLVSQRDGSDLDPHGLKHRPRPSDGEFGQRRTVGADVGKVQEGTIYHPDALHSSENQSLDHAEVMLSRAAASE